MEKWNLSRTLRGAKSLVKKLPSGWKLTSDGVSHIKLKLGLTNKESATKESELKLS